MDYTYISTHGYTFRVVTADIIHTPIEPTVNFSLQVSKPPSHVDAVLMVAQVPMEDRFYEVATSGYLEYETYDAALQEALSWLGGSYMAILASLGRIS